MRSFDPIFRPQEKIAFVLSGGGNLGALQAGALIALLENNIKPDILVGTSVGSINATAIAANPVLHRAKWLVELWKGFAKQKVFQNNYFNMAKRFLCGRCSLMSNTRLYDFVKSNITSPTHTFADINGVKLFITATDIDTAKLHVFGIDQKEYMVDAMMASTALPFYLPPWEYNGHRYVDGAILSDVPIKVASKMGANEIYALDAVDRTTTGKKLAHLYDIWMQLSAIVIKRHLLDELDWARHSDEINVHYIPLSPVKIHKDWDFSESQIMLDDGYETTLKYLKKQPLHSEKISALSLQ
jgi:NTE family protein